MKTSSWSKRFYRSLQAKIDKNGEDRERERRKRFERRKKKGDVCFEKKNDNNSGENAKKKFVWRGGEKSRFARGRTTGKTGEEVFEKSRKRDLKKGKKIIKGSDGTELREGTMKTETKKRPAERMKKEISKGPNTAGL